MYKPKIFHSNKSKGFHVDHSKRINPYNIPDKHFHSWYEIYYLLSGDRNCFIQDRVYNMQKGDLVLINSNVMHRTLDGSTGFHERILIEFDVSFFEDFLVDFTELQLLNSFNKDFNILRLKEPEKKQLENCIFKIIQESKENNIEKNITLKIYFLELLIIINKFSFKSKDIKFEHPSEQHKRITEIINYINFNYMNDIGLDSVAREFFISEAHLSRAFKKVTGFSFIEYLQSLRIKEAQRLLVETRFNISEIAEQVGYQSITNFGRVFKSINGISPREYRKLL
jgi:AraC-like DNA-binding protein